MVKRKRNSPERKPAPRVAGRLLDGVGALARLVGRYPRTVGGFSAFAVAFGFIAANALWYQPGHHPSPIFSTRDVSDFNALSEAIGDFFPRPQQATGAASAPTAPTS